MALLTKDVRDWDSGYLLEYRKLWRLFGTLFWESVGAHLSKYDINLSFDEEIFKFALAFARTSAIHVLLTQAYYAYASYVKIFYAKYVFLRRYTISKKYSIINHRVLNSFFPFYLYSYSVCKWNVQPSHLS